MSAVSFDFASLSPVERIALADAIYESAMQAIDSDAAQITAEQLAEIDHRIAQIHLGHLEVLQRDDVLATLMRGRECFA